jgi:hypothetical protein
LHVCVFDRGRGYIAPIVAEEVVPVCIFCGDAVERDEPLIVIEHDGERETSFAREPGLRERARALLAHVRCAPAWRSRTS